MVREIVHDPILLGIPSAETTEADSSTAADLADTLVFHKKGCVGMAANMIGVRKNIIAFFERGKVTVMFDPVIIQKSRPYETKEGCLSLPGELRPVTRYDSIKLRYTDKYRKTHEKRYTGVTAQIIQHEIDHCKGILI
ncbi:MAG: peptide deformylase [Oscillospiraceae bacterium]|nr:peptide deformylase [Oscillospiraceae bacterium]